VVVGWFRTAVDEARWISTEVGRLHEEGTPWREIGVLFRKHRQIGLVRDALERQGVPVEVASLGGLLEVPEVAELHAWLALLGRPDDGPSLMRILLGSRYRLGLGDIAPLARWVHRAHRADAGDHSPVRPSLLEAIDHLDDCEGPTDRAVERLVAFRRTYRSLLEFAHGTSLVELSRIVLDRTGAWPEVEALDEAARLSARLNLYRFLDLAEEWSPLEGRPSLEAFLDYLDLLQEDRSADELDTARVGGEDAVALLTVHRAKGLEWPVVFLPSLCDGTFPSGSGGYPDPVAKPQYLPYELRLDSEYLLALPENESERRDLLKALHAGQEWRTAYVAVTRAARRLVATGAFWYTAKRPKSPSRILELALETPGAEIVEMVSAPGDPPDTLRFATDTSEGPDAVFSDGWREALRGAVAGSFLPAERAKELGLGAALEEARGQLRLVLDGLPTAPTGPGPPEPLRTSVTGLVTFAACPQRFHWSEVDRLPRRPSAALRHGLEVHRRIELHHRGAVPFEEAREGFFDVGPGERGEPGAFGAFLSSRYAELKPILVEAPFTLRIGGASIAGRIDAVYEAEPGWWEVVDFKTGRPSDDPARRVQLQAYAVAIMESGFGGGPPRDLRVAFVHLGNGVEVLAEDVDDGWLADAREHLADLVTRAAAGERDARPSAACRSCDFSRFCEPGRRWLAKRTRPDSG
jgi:DNA helicase-2/ATP-dependent DNA helicase PcrA